jgi:diacylglycerol kinase family enzyme
MRRAVFLINPLLAKRGGRRAALERCAAMLRAEGCGAEVLETQSAGSAGNQAREAVEGGFDTIFACGGDGTLFQVLQGVAGSDAALGVIPLGTGNVLARNLHLPRDPVAALRAQWNADRVTIPLGEVVCGEEGASQKSWYFTIAAGVGFHAALMGIAPSGLAKRLWGRGAYYGGSLKMLLRRPIRPFGVKLITADDQPCEFCACELLAVRVPAIDRWRPGGDLRSPHLRVAAVPHTGRVGLAHASFHAFVTGRCRDHEIKSARLPYPHYFNVAEIVCQPVSGFTYQDPLMVEADGEVIGAERAKLKMAQKRLRLIWPKG